MKKCMYCKCDVSEECVVDFCERCGKGVFGKMYGATVQRMEEARKRGDLDQVGGF